jgi:thioesterase domain-containing protein/peptidoglycan/xylan/chitin deacetylase (PgdA/CDA1 family)
MDDNVASPLCGTPELPPECVALTFDDGPGPKSAELARMLREEGVPGTFFVLGENLERYGHVLDTYRDCGHAIGLHGDQHRPFKSVEDAAGQLSNCARRISNYPGDTAWFRPPYGMGDWPVPGFAGPVGWHAHGRDWDIIYRHGQTVDACVEAITRQVVQRRGGIVLLHDFAPPSQFRPAGLTEADLDLRVIDVTTSLIGRLRGAGLRFVGLPDPSPAAAPAEPRPAQGRPAAGESGGPARAGGAAGMIAAADVQALRTHRTFAKASGGFLDTLMPMRDGDAAPLFCAHPVVGLSWCYLSMLPHVDPRYPLYGLQARGLQRPEPLPASMREMARDYADQIRTRQPAGPYHLLGWSLGGNVAFAIAEELQDRGERIGLLVILDSRLVNLDSSELSEPWLVYNLILAQFGYVPALTAAEPSPESRMLELVRRRPGLGLDEWPDWRVRGLHRVIKNNMAVALSYQPGRVHCPLLLFSATQNPPELARKLDNWRRFVDGPIEAFEVDCDHRHMMLPEPAARIGPAVSAALARATGPGPAPIVQPPSANLAL